MMASIIQARMKRHVNEGREHSLVEKGFYRAVNKSCLQWAFDFPQGGYETSKVRFGEQFFHQFLEDNQDVATQTILHLSYAMKGKDNVQSTIDKIVKKAYILGNHISVTKTKEFRQRSIEQVQLAVKDFAQEYGF